MSSRDDRKRGDRSWEKDERDRARGGGGGRDRDRDRDRDKDRNRDRGRRGDYSGRRSRSRSPVRRGERDRKDYGRDRNDDRRERDRYRERDRDRLEGHRDRDRDRDRLKDDKEPRRDRVDDKKLPPSRDQDERERGTPVRSGPSQKVVNSPGRGSGRPNLDPDYDGQEEGEEREDAEPMDAENEEEAAMRALMGFGGFDSTKGKPVVGNEEGAVNIKKMRTWRQYMNRRGGFNRPLDKIK